MTPWTIACQAPLSMGLFRQEYWNGLPFVFPGALNDPGIEPRSPALQAEWVQINLGTPLIFYTKPKFFLGPSLIKDSKPFFVLLTPHKFMHLCLKSIKANCFCHFSGPVLITPTCAQIQLISFSLLICLVVIFSLDQSQKSS